MSIISTNSTNRRNNNAQNDTSEFDGLWINVGVSMGDEEDQTFVRLPRGIAVADLVPAKIYANTSPEYAAQATLMNQMIELLQKKSSALAEGESVPVNLSVQLYRRQEEAEAVTSSSETHELEAALFG